METQPILLTGAAGRLGQACQRVAHIRGLPTVALPHADLDITDAAALAQALRRYQPWAVVNAAGCVSIDAAEADTARCYRANTTGPRRLAAACAAHGAQLLTFSCDLDSMASRPVRTASATRPTRSACTATASCSPRRPCWRSCPAPWWCAPALFSAPGMNITS